MAAARSPDILSQLARLELTAVAEALKEDPPSYFGSDAEEEEDSATASAQLRTACRAGRQLANIAVTELKVRAEGMTRRAFGRSSLDGTAGATHCFRLLSCWAALPQHLYCFTQCV